MVNLNVRNELSPPEQAIEGLAGDELVEAIKAWFLSNFEDPAESTPYDSGEGGYQWIWGGPYDAREEIEGYFGDELPGDIVDQVVADLEGIALEWAPNSNRIYDEDDLEPSEPSGPELPQQGYGPHFEIGADGVVTLAPPAALDARGNNVDRLNRMLPSLRELSNGLVEELSKGNSPHHHLLARAHVYQDLINHSLEQIDFSMLYIAGVRLANAERAATGDADLPPLPVPSREAVESLLQVHGSFILASADGLEVLAAEQRYNRTREEEQEYRAAAVEFAQKLQHQPHIVDAEAASAVLNAVEEIGRGANIERSGTAATGILLNATITISIAASLGALTAGAIATGSVPLIVVMGAAALVATEGLKKSKPFAALASFVTEKIDEASAADVAVAAAAVRKRFGRQSEFFRNVRPQLKRLAAINDQSFRWLGPTIRWLDEKTSEESELPFLDSNLTDSLPAERRRQPRPARIGTEGNIYLAKVSRVEQSLDAAFVNYGAQRDGFLPFSEINPDYFQIPSEERQILRRQQRSNQSDLDARANAASANDPHISQYKLSDVIKRRQVMLVQVAKDPPASRSARLTTYLSLSGRYIVLLPNTALGSGASSQLEPNEGIRLMEIVRQIDVPEGMGLVLRPSSAFRTERDIRQDYESLVHIWETVRDLALKSAAPTLVYDAGQSCD
ncbi:MULTISPECIES: ribonuclease E/G [unclassified Bradyrhizobium]|uniref:ribonuclease E/G n=1 Tax=unclassified Bradyrhizobium TaxID=2631580 RepID=UPI0028EC4C37|nr:MULTISPECIES: ribonuclease E/G [unclassified Bradyrhizobium]